MPPHLGSEKSGGMAFSSREKSSSVGSSGLNCCLLEHILRFGVVGQSASGSSSSSTFQRKALTVTVILSATVTLYVIVTTSVTLWLRSQPPLSLKLL